MIRKLINTIRNKFVGDSTIDYVNLGLPSGTKWMKCNIGANKETDYGLYFQWGDTVGYSGDDAKAHSYWATCPGNGDASSYDKTAIAAWDKDNLTDGVLNADVDTAYVHTNGKVKMPTVEQFRELIDYTKSAWVTIDGVNGRKFTSKSNPSKYVFFPACGHFYNGSKCDIGSYGCYGSSLVDSSGSSLAQPLFFNSSDVFTYHDYRYYARSVRGVLI